MGPRRARLATALAGILLTMVALGLPGPAADAQVLPPLPPLPEELDPLLETLSPTIWTACDGIGFTSTLLLLLGLPTEVTSASDTLLGTVLGLCSLVPVPQDAPACAIDESIPPLGGLGRPIAPGAILVTQLDALDAMLDQVLGQMTGILAPPIAGALGCAPETVDSSPPPPEGTLPPVDTTAPAPPPVDPAAPSVLTLPAPSGPDVAAPRSVAPRVGTRVASASASGWTLGRVVLVGLALALGAFGLPRVSFPNERFRPRR